MKLGLSAGIFCQSWREDTLGVPGMLKDNLCSHQTKLEVLTQNKLTVLQNKHT